ncbi:hypothetical protein BGZ70_005925 [Mortierella alpina]|uniref:Uncharacterized protein n=1 Tax=Mortierella alpina TaxID=64518 RepID=A0A9P6M488_MORAP|nr:hypothetical protein BGZ70_005925 [Mortierella alpina]
MNSAQLEYLATTPGQSVSIQEWARLADELDAEAMEGLWTSKVLGALHSSQHEEDKEAYTRLSRQKSEARMDTFKDVLTDRRLKHELRPIVSRQEIVVAKEQATEIEDAVSLKRRMQAPTKNNAPKRRNTIFTRTIATSTPTTEKLASSAASTSTLDISAIPQPSNAGRSSKSPNAKEFSFADTLSSFNDSVDLQDDATKWVLKTGTTVDDILVGYARNCKTQEAVHSFVFDTSNQDIMRLFSNEERKEILTNKGSRISNDPAVVKYLMSFNKTTVAGLRQRLSTNDADNVGTGAEGTNAQSVPIRRWIYKTILTMADVIEGKAHNGYGQYQSERWFELHIWKMVDDYVLNDADINLIRGEPTSVASAFRKNGASRPGIERKKLGRRIDGLYLSRHHDIEVGGIELGPEEQDAIGTKYQHDGLKLQKLLKDQFDYALMHSVVTKEGLMTMGLQLLGRTMQILSLDWIAGAFLRFRRDEPCRLPLEVKMTSELLFAMSQLMAFHEQMRVNIAKLEVAAEADLTARLIGPCTTPPPKHRPMPTAISPGTSITNNKP